MLLLHHKPVKLRAEPPAGVEPAPRPYKGRVLAVDTTEAFSPDETDLPAGGKLDSGRPRAQRGERARLGRAVTAVPLDPRLRLRRGERDELDARCAPARRATAGWSRQSASFVVTSARIRSPWPSRPSTTFRSLERPWASRCQMSRRGRARMEKGGVEPPSAACKAGALPVELHPRKNKCGRVESNHHSARRRLYRPRSSPGAQRPQVRRPTGRPTGFEPAPRGSRPRMLPLHHSHHALNGDDRTRTGAVSLDRRALFL